MEGRYTEEQTHAVLNDCGVDIVSETATDWLAMCPFHANTHSPAFTVGKENGLFMCHNGACAETGTLVQLVERTNNVSLYEARRKIARRGSETYDLARQLEKQQEKPLPNIPKVYTDAMVEEFWATQAAQDYMYGRGFRDAVLIDFEVGFENDMVVVPIMNEFGDQCVGLNRRSIEGKQFRLSSGFPKKRVLFNLHNARKRHNVIVCESQFDVMMLAQAGYPNAVCSLGSNMSPQQIQLLTRYFDTVTIMTDADEAGRQMGLNLASQARGLKVKWAYHGDVLYPDGAKDVCDMTEAQIKQCLHNALGDLEYKSLL